MVAIDTFRKLALSFENATEQPHFEKISFRIKNKIFATLDTTNKSVVLKLSLIDQSVFCAFDKTVIYPVAGAWGKQGWTTVELKKVKKTMLKDALTAAYYTTTRGKVSTKKSLLKFD